MLVFVSCSKELVVVAAAMLFVRRGNVGGAAAVWVSVEVMYSIKCRSRGGVLSMAFCTTSCTALSTSSEEEGWCWWWSTAVCVLRSRRCSMQ